MSSLHDSKLHHAGMASLVCTKHKRTIKQKQFSGIVTNSWAFQGISEILISSWLTTNDDIGNTLVARLIHNGTINKNEEFPVRNLSCE